MRVRSPARVLVLMGLFLGWMSGLTAWCVESRAQERPEVPTVGHPRAPIEPANQTASTVTGGTSTGLFLTLGPRTLRRGEFTLSASWSNFDRDPGDVDINQIPLSVTFGVTHRLELFVTANVFQQMTSRQPFALSGYQFHGVRRAFGGDPLVAFGPPIGGREGAAAFFPLSGARLGGILPPPGSFFGPAILADRPSFVLEWPFFGPATFLSRELGFDVERSANGLGDVTVGVKAALTEPSGSFPLSVAALLRLPSARHLEALARGRSSGATDVGVILISAQNYLGHRLRFVQNIGYVRSGDPKLGGVKVLDRRDQLLLNAGVEIAPAQWLVLVAEWANAIAVSSGTPRLNALNPSDLLLGARFYGYEGRIQVGGGWRRLLNQSDGRTIPVFQPGRGVSPLDIGSRDANGFIVNLALARRASILPPPPPNRSPSVTLFVDRAEVRDGERVTVEARAFDPDNDVLTYAWTVEPPVPQEAVRAVGVPPGAPPGNRLVLETAGLNPTPGAPPRTFTVTVYVEDGRGGVASDRRVITVTSPPPPPPPPPPPAPPPNRPPVIQDLEIAPVGTPQVPGQITDGDLLRIRAIAHDPDGDVLVYRWSATAGRWVGIGSEITFDTAGVTIGPGGPPVTVTITVVVDDGRGGTESRSRAITVMAVRRPEPVRQPALFFGLNAARITNLHKAVLDDVADRLRQDPRATLVVDGHQDRAERPSVARTRARNTAEYLIRQRGIDRARIQIRSFDARRPHESGQRRRNRRVELWILPAGAEMPPDSAGSTSRDIAPWREPHLSARARPAEMLSLASSEHPAKEKRRRPLRVMPRVSAHISPPREESDAPPRVGEQVPRAPGERRSENW